MRTRVALTSALLIALFLFLPPCSGEGELFLDDGKAMTISGRTLILTSDITVKNESQLMVTNSRIQLSVRGERGYNVSVLDKGTIILSNSMLQSLFNASTITLSGNSNVTFYNSNITGFNVLSSTENSSLEVQGGQIIVPYVNCSGKAFSITDGFMAKGDLHVNTPVANLDRFKGDRVFVNVGNSTLKRIECCLLAVKSVGPIYLNSSRAGNCSIQSDQKTVTADSTYDSLKFLSSGVAVNVSISKGKAGGPIYADTNVTIQRYWYLKVNVTDLAGTGIPAKIIIEDYFGKTMVTGEADAKGLYLEPTLAEIINSSKTNFIGNYRVRAEYLNYTTRSVPVVLDENRYVELKFTDSIPLETTTKLTVHPIVVKVGEPVKMRGWINSGKPGEHIEMIVSGPNNSRVETVYKTGEGGVFEGEFRPYIEGRWIIYADWLGGSPQGITTRSQAFIVTAEPRPSILILFIRALPIAIVVLGICVAVAFLVLGRFKESRL